MRKAVAVLLVLVSLFSFTACFDMREIDDVLYVLWLGIDKGSNDKWRITIKYNPMTEDKGGSGGQSSQGQGGGEEAGDYASVDAPSFFAAVSVLNTIMPREISFAHTQLIIFSEEIAKSGNINEYIAPLNRYYELRRSASVYICKGDALDIIKNNKPQIGKSVTRNFLIMHDVSNDTGMLPKVTLEKFQAGINSKTEQAIAAIISSNESGYFKEEGDLYTEGVNDEGTFIAGQIPRDAQYKVEVCGTAIFDGEKLAANLTGEETRYLLMARGELKNATITLKDPENRKKSVSLKVTLATKPRIKVKFYNDKPIIDATIMLDAEILSIQGDTPYEQKSYMGYLQETARIQIKNGIEDLIEKCKKINVDAFGFGQYAKRRFLTIGDMEKYNWNQSFCAAEVFVHTEVFIRRTGEIIQR